MAYSYNIDGDKYSCDSNAHGILGKIGINITESDGRVEVDFSGRSEMNLLEVQNYKSSFGGHMAEFSNASGSNTLKVKPADNFGFREVAAMIAGRALDLGGKLGEDFKAEVRKHGTPVLAPGLNPHLATTSP